MRKAKRSVCPIACVLDLIGDKWTLLVVRDLACGKAHFNEISRSPERIASNILADRLEKLVASGLVEKVSSSAMAGRDAYQLSDKGRSLGPLLTEMARWGLTHIKGTKAQLTPKFED